MHWPRLVWEILGTRARGRRVLGLPLMALRFDFGFVAHFTRHMNTFWGIAITVGPQLVSSLRKWVMCQNTRRYPGLGLQANGVRVVSACVHISSCED